LDAGRDGGIADDFVTVVIYTTDVN